MHTTLPCVTGCRETRLTRMIARHASASVISAGETNRGGANSRPRMTAPDTPGHDLSAPSRARARGSPAPWRTQLEPKNCPPRGRFLCRDQGRLPALAGLPSQSPARLPALTQTPISISISIAGRPIAGAAGGAGRARARRRAYRPPGTLSAALRGALRRSAGRIDAPGRSIDGNGRWQNPR